MRKKRFVVFFLLRNFNLYAIYWHFSYITLVNICFQATAHSFLPRGSHLLLEKIYFCCFILKIQSFIIKGVNFRFLEYLFKYNCGDYRYIHGMRRIDLGYFFPTITMEIRTFHLRTSMVQGGIFSNYSIFMDPMKWDLSL